jgi:hypothetical protein
MSEPLTSVIGVVSGTAGITFAALFPEATPAVMICALIGTILYILTTENPYFWKQIVFAGVSFIGGIYCAEFVSEIIAGLLNTFFHRLNTSISVTVPHAVGALVGSVVCVTVLLKILSRVRNHKIEKTEEDE